MGIVATQTAVPTRFDPLVALLESSPQFVAAGAERPHFLVVLWGMRIVAGAALTLYRRWMTVPLLPEGVDLMAVDTEGRLLLQQVTRFVVTVGVVADRAIAMGGGDRLGHFAAGMTGHAQAVGGTGQLERLIGGMGIMTELAAPLAEGLMATRLLALIFDLRMTGRAQGDAGIEQQLLLIGPMGIMATGALTSGKRTVQTGAAHVLIHGLMTLAAQGALVFDQQAAEFALVGLVTGAAMPVPGRRMRYSPGSGGG